jgi:hypothetical protein
MFQELPSAPTAGTAASVKSSSTVEAGSAACWGETMESTAAANWSAAAESAIKSDPAASIESWPATIKTGATPVESAATIVAMEPRPRADKRAPDEIVRTVVAIRRACIWRRVIVAIGAYRSRPDISWPTVNWPDSNSDSKPDLCVGSPCPCNRHQKPQHHRVL